MNGFDPSAGFGFTHGDSIHTSRDPRPHLKGFLNGETVHVPFQVRRPSGCLIAARRLIGSAMSSN